MYIVRFQEVLALQVTVSWCATSGHKQGLFNATI